jgi:SAM-dependent methyltransferase
MGLVDAVNEYISVSLHESGGMLDLLDVGPGSGRTMQYLDHYGSADMVSFYGIDINNRRLSTIYGKERWKLILADVTEGLPYPPNRFDIVVCEQVLEHLRNPEFVIRQMERVLRPGGLLVVGVPSRPPGIAAIVRFLKSSGVGGGHIQVFTLFSLAKLIGKSGELDVFQVRGFRFTSGGPLGLLENTRWFTATQFISRQTLPLFLWGGSVSLP